MRSITFDSTSISSGNYTVRRVLHDKATPRDLYLYELTREGGASLVNAEWKPKKIVIEGTIKGATIATLETNIDTFKQLLSGQNKNLDIQYENGTRRYVATVNSITIERDYYHLNYAPFSVEFTIPSGIGKDITTSLYMTQSIILHTLENVSFTTTGSAIPKCTIELDFVTASSVSQVSVTINGDKITVSETITAGQVLIIDTENKKVTINGVEKRYTGLFPRLQLGSNSYMIATSSSSHMYDVTITYTKTYL
jgi:phage-related protein